MLTLPDAILPVLHPFATLFRNPTWLAQILKAHKRGNLQCWFLAR